MTSIEGVIVPSAMDVRGQKITLEILDVIKTAQSQNGLRHSDYVRYRRFCTKRLDRLRSAKSEFHYGHSKVFENRKLTPDMITEARHLQIPLFNAERAWAQSQEIQLELSALGEASGPKYSHMVSRLRKAVQYATELLSLSRDCADTRTVLEAEAYSLYMSGSYAVLRTNWEDGENAFHRCRMIYDELSKIASRKQRDQFQERVSEVEPLERYCVYNLMRKQGMRAADASASASLKTSQQAHSDISDKVTSLTQQVDSNQNNGISNILWRSTKLNLGNAKLKSLLSTFHEKARQFVYLSEADSSTHTINTSFETTMSNVERIEKLLMTNESGSSLSSGNNSAILEGMYMDIRVRSDELLKLLKNEATTQRRSGLEGDVIDTEGVYNFVLYLRLFLLLQYSIHSLYNQFILLISAIEFIDLNTVMSGIDSKNESPFSKSFYFSMLLSSSTTSSSSSVHGLALFDKLCTDLIASTNTVIVLFEHMSTVLGNSLDGSTGKPGSNSSGAFRSSVFPSSYASLHGYGSIAALNPPIPSELPVDYKTIDVVLARRDVFVGVRALLLAFQNFIRRDFGKCQKLLHIANDRSVSARKSLESLQFATIPKQASYPSFETSDTSLDLTGLSELDFSLSSRIQEIVSKKSMEIDLSAVVSNVSTLVHPDSALMSLYSVISGVNSPKDVLSGFSREGKNFTLFSALHPYSTSLALDTVVNDNIDVLRESGSNSVSNSKRIYSNRIFPAVSPVLPVPVRPVLLDLAFNGVQYPDLGLDDDYDGDHKLKKSSQNSAPTTPGGRMLSWLTGR